MSDKLNLFDIHHGVEVILRDVDYQDGELTDEQEIALSELEIEANIKLLSVAGAVKTLEGEIAGVKVFKDEISDRLNKLKALHERMKQWIWKGAKLHGIITGDSQKGYEATKISSNQMEIRWRKSRATELDENAQDVEGMKKAYPDFFDYEIRVTREGGFMLQELIEEGNVEVLKAKFRKSEAEKEMKKNPEVGISGVRTTHRINLQIKV